MYLNKCKYSRLVIFISLFGILLSNGVHSATVTTTTNGDLSSKLKSATRVFEYVGSNENIIYLKPNSIETFSFTTTGSDESNPDISDELNAKLFNINTIVTGNIE